MRTTATTLSVGEYPPPNPAVRSSAAGAVIVALLLSSPTSSAMPTVRSSDRTLPVLDNPDHPKVAKEATRSDVSVAAAVLAIKSSSGLTWESLAEVMNVSRRTMHLWANGAPVNATNEQRLRRLEGVLAVLKGGGSAKNLLWAAVDGQPLIDVLRAGDFDRALVAAKQLRAVVARKAKDDEPQFLTQLGGYSDRPIADSPYAGRSRKKRSK